MWISGGISSIVRGCKELFGVAIAFIEFREITLRIPSISEKEKE